MQALRSLDYFKKLEQEYNAIAKGERLGGVMSLLAMVAMIVLSFSSLRSYLVVEEQSEIALLMSEENTMIRVSFNITMDHLPCEYLTIDLKNALGTKQLNISKNVHRYTVKHGAIDATAKGRVKPTEHFHEEVHKDDPVHLIELGEGHVTLLNEGSFKPFVEDPAREAVWVNFHAPWCKWCKLLEPTWEKTAIAMKAAAMHSVVLASVDCVKTPNICQAHRVRGFPTLKVFHQSVLSDVTYHGDRTTDKFIAYVNEVILSYHHMQDAKAKSRALSRLALEEGAHLGAQEGCNVVGFIEVATVPGTLQITAHSPEHDFSAHQLDMSHTVNHLSIGDDVLKKLVPSAPHEYQMEAQRELLHDLQMKIAKHSVSMHELLTHVAPLDATKWEAKGATKTTFTHYLRVVPTIFDGFLPITFTSKNHAPGAAIGVSRSYQFIAHSHQYRLAGKKGADGGAEGCVSWRQTAGCDPNGDSESSGDRPCDVTVQEGWSGYCECADGIKLQLVGCGRESFLKSVEWEGFLLCVVCVCA